MDNEYSAELVRSSSQTARHSTNVNLIFSGYFTFAFWVKLRSNPSSGQVYGLICKRNLSSQLSYRVYYHNIAGVPRIVVTLSSNGSSESNADFNYTLSTSAWTHIVVTRNTANGDVELWANGSKVGTVGSMPTSTYNGTADFVLGDNVSDSSVGNYADVYLNDMRLWSRLLSDSEIGDLYSDPCTFDNGSALGAWWRFQNDWTDESGNSLTLTPGGGASFFGDVPYTCAPPVTYVISGEVTLSGTPVEGAIIRCIKQSDNTTVAYQESDINGLYEFDDLDEGELYHLCVEYEDESQKYYALSYWDIAPVEVEI